MKVFKKGALPVFIFLFSLLSLAAITQATSISNIEAGNAHSLAVTADGSVVAWGSNFGGQLGDTSYSDQYTAVQVVDSNGNPVTGVKALAGHQFHTLALMEDGTVLAWGSNSSGQLGDGTDNSRRYAMPVLETSGQPLTGIKAIAAGSSHSLAVKTDGTLLAWGRNYIGQLGDGTTTMRYYPVPVLDTSSNPLTGIKDVAASWTFSVALKEDGTVLAWGDNSYGHLGDGTTSHRRNPVLVKDINGIPITNVAEIDSGMWFSVALQSDGTVLAWGANWSGELGVDTEIINDYRPYAARVLYGSGLPLTGFSGIDAGNRFSFAMHQDGTLWAWGDNEYGNLGDGSIIDKFSPVVVQDMKADALTGILEFSAGGNHAVILKNDGTVHAWGFNRSGQLGDNTVTDRTTAVLAKRKDGRLVANFEIPDYGNEPDVDGDSMPDAFELNYGLDPYADDAGADHDLDGLTNLVEYKTSTFPDDSDTDKDGLLDGDDQHPLAVIDDFEAGLADYWTFGGDGTWELTTRERHSDFHAIGTPALTENNQNSLLEWTRDCEQGTVSFWLYKNNSMDYFRFYIDGVQMWVQYYHSVYWQELSFPVAEGLHTFTWEYTKSNYNAQVDDWAVADDITFTVKGTEEPHDLDQDGMPDTYEFKQGFSSYDPSDALANLDNDGLINVHEYLNGTDPANPDTNGDGILDGPPSVTISSPIIATNDTTPILLYTLTSGEVEKVVVDGVIVNKRVGDSLDLLWEGRHTVEVHAVDAAGNTGFSYNTFDVDTRPPYITIDPVDRFTKLKTYTITGTMEYDVTVTITADTGAVPGVVTYPGAHFWSCTITNLAYGANNITATAQDAAGNTISATTVINSKAR